MAAYVEGSVRLRWIDRTKRARLGAEEPDFWAIQIMLSLDASGRRYSRTGCRSKGLRSNPASTSLGERIGLLLASIDLQERQPRLHWLVRVPI